MSNQSAQSNTKTTRITQRPVLVGIALLSLLTGLAVGAVLLEPRFSQAFQLATTRQPERLTELYFNDHQNLPKQITAGRLSSFSYHLANHESMTITYNVRVIILENNQPRILKIDNVTLVDGASADQPIQFTTANPNTPLTLIVQILGRDEIISFGSKS